MSLTENYLSENGYDYYGNAAEDTLVFFVRDEDSPSSETSPKRSNEAIPNLSDDIVNTQTSAQVYAEGKGDNSTNFDVQQTKTSADNEYSDNSVSGSLSAPDDNREGDDISETIPHLAPIDEKQTDTQQSRFKN